MLSSQLRPAFPCLSTFSFEMGRARELSSSPSTNMGSGFLISVISNCFQVCTIWTLELLVLALFFQHHLTLIPHRCSQRLLSQVVLHFIKFTIGNNHQIYIWVCMCVMCPCTHEYVCVPVLFTHRLTGWGEREEGARPSGWGWRAESMSQFKYEGCQAGELSYPAWERSDLCPLDLHLG